MSDRDRSRDPERETKERTAFILLQHIYCLTPEKATVCCVGKIASDLALPESRITAMVEHLAGLGYVEWAGGATQPVRITGLGREYIERRSRRRRSLRISGFWP